MSRGCRTAERRTAPQRAAAWGRPPEPMESSMAVLSRRVAAALSLGLLWGAPLAAAENPKEIYVDWATYNPVSMLLKEKRYLENEFSKDGIKVVWVKTVSSSNALQFLNANSINFGSSAGSAALVARINGNPIKSVYVYSRPEWTALVTTRDSGINRVEDLKGKRVAMVRGTDPHIFAVRALLSAGLTDKDIVPVLVQQHADGGTALIRGDVDAWAGLDPMMAQHELRDGARLFYRNPEANTWGILNVREEFAEEHPDIVRRVIAGYERARKFSLANYDELKRIFIGVTGLDSDVVDKQLKERTELTHNKVGPAQRESILEAGIALQKAGVIGAGVDVKKALDELVDDRYVSVTN
jgi:sulfonate transport system substrate-binding protein